MYGKRGSMDRGRKTGREPNLTPNVDTTVDAARLEARATSEFRTGRRSATQQPPFDKQACYAKGVGKPQKT
jgi:hypothetical protein